MRADQKIQALGSVALFAACNRKELAKIASLVERVEAGEDKVLMREGTPGREFFVIVQGMARVSLRGRRIARLGPGDFFGEMALLDQGPRSATVVAETPMTLLVLEARAFDRVLEEVPTVTKKMLRGLASRIRSAEKRPAG